MPAADAPQHDRVRAARPAGVRARLLGALRTGVGAEDQDRVGRERQRAGGAERGLRLARDLALLDLRADEEQHERERQPGADRERDPQQHAAGGDAAAGAVARPSDAPAPRAAATRTAAPVQLVEPGVLAAQALAQAARPRAVARVRGWGPAPAALRGGPSSPARWTRYAGPSPRRETSSRSSAMPVYSGRDAAGVRYRGRSRRHEAACRRGRRRPQRPQPRPPRGARARPARAAGGGRRGGRGGARGGGGRGDGGRLRDPVPDRPAPRDGDDGREPAAQRRALPRPDGGAARAAGRGRQRRQRRRARRAARWRGAGRRATRSC